MRCLYCRNQLDDWAWVYLGFYGLGPALGLGLGGTANS